VAGLEIVLNVQAITYPRTSTIRSISSPALGLFGPYLNAKPLTENTPIAGAEIELTCSQVAEALAQCFVVWDRFLMAFEYDLLI
jgi:hypothetical protein